VVGFGEAAGYGVKKRLIQQQGLGAAIHHGVGFVAAGFRRRRNFNRRSVADDDCLQVRVVILIVQDARTLKCAGVKVGAFLAAAEDEKTVIQRVGGGIGGCVADRRT